jgi:hypothetical protein
MEGRQMISTESVIALVDATTDIINTNNLVIGALTKRVIELENALDEIRKASRIVDDVVTVPVGVWDNVMRSIERENTDD